MADEASSTDRMTTGRMGEPSSNAVERIATSSASSSRPKTAIGSPIFADSPAT
jgi:hypothetical protein